ncbi:hypothetical protein BDV97DRAFT_72198 [Delphinella strobiligena]|nr:hypothetical protein BDV97DRAFT_72198 [Delphinella strobiligena]
MRLLDALYWTYLPSLAANGILLALFTLAHLNVGTLSFRLPRSCHGSRGVIRFE